MPGSQHKVFVLHEVSKNFPFGSMSVMNTPEMSSQVVTFKVACFQRSKNSTRKILFFGIFHLY